MKRLLIANRGEIARRVIRTARRMGIETVAVCSDADRQALHGREADAVVPLGGNSSAESYLRIDKLIDAARASGADAVHPGYGFLSENADFAHAVIDAGLIWVGPPPAAIRALGSKSAAKALALRQGVPVLPGYFGDDQRDATFLAEAARVGYPVMVKAVAGGGGRGMRLVHNADQLPAALHSARSEALASFGSADLLIERALLRPRHVEVQVFADTHGHVIHLGERDCSVQRRHQKIIEEAPSPAVTPELRAEVGRCAVALAQGAGYVGAGTVEFLLDQGVTDDGEGFAAGPPQGETHPLGGQRPAQRRSVGGSFFLMEMNTRLQVEHPVTEMLTGLDLVEWQIRVARGEPLPTKQEEIRLQGHAIEVRLCAEDEYFIPHAGTVHLFNEPLLSEGLRFDHALESGAVVTPHYDAMLGKLIAHAPSRDEALDRLAQALDDTVLLGLPSNRAFLAACLRHPVFRSGEAGIPFLAEHGDALRVALAPSAQAQVTAAVAASYGGRTPAHELPSPFPRTQRWRVGTQVLDLVLREQGGSRVSVQVGDTQHEAVFTPGALALDGVSRALTVVALAESDPPAMAVRWGSDVFELVDLSLAAPEGAGGGPSANELRAPFNGKLVALAAQAGARVTRGQTLMTIESMKIEHQITAPRDGAVAAVPVAPGQQVTPGQVLLTFEPESR
ncbi:MAG TPA: biotin carboxylase N-terminal domain-containing protein [Hydrogenophaga sp.]|uniref:acetyl/propionyl/methylcrotonyl-CoA carboxylase subunit alpha n=1 Tax=Hydrogenophaga sp. TaxID=1904254 RepID=UPI002B56E308|nr:biotin carboxylase N-terminal domain-containing protein [Hydrogenophaga sp.]HMN94163.1 biotin carboxylase N-terminal domain-containing protein [Hydrogenophaga sp.]HMP09591.1 biotin carboxylase N-terminal domain-containing protein [Hydrogenophaga sp.]